MKNMLELLLVISFSALIGYLAQITGLCLVRGIGDWSKGRRLRLIAILLSGFGVYLYVPLMSPNSSVLMGYESDWSFFLGGLLFGLGAAANGACSISTATRLSSGDSHMLFTIVGWLGGWLALEATSVEFKHVESTARNDLLSWAIVVCIALASIWVLLRHRKYWKIWGGIMLVGILAGAVFMLQPAWSPSDFVRDTGLAVLRNNPQMLPALDRIAILLAMLLGMSIGAWQYGRFKLLGATGIGIVRHLLSGMLMGVGAAICLGGNDFQLLLALPAQSHGGLLAIAGMLIGIRFWLYVNQRAQTRKLV